MSYDLKIIASQTKEEILSTLQTNMNAGLISMEAIKRLKESGINMIPSHKKESWWQDILQHSKSPLVILLLIALVLTDFFQERDARNASEKLKHTVMKN